MVMFGIDDLVVKVDDVARGARDIEILDILIQILDRLDALPAQPDPVVLAKLAQIVSKLPEALANLQGAAPPVPPEPFDLGPLTAALQELASPQDSEEIVRALGDVKQAIVNMPRPTTRMGGGGTVTAQIKDSAGEKIDPATEGTLANVESTLADIESSLAAGFAVPDTAARTSVSVSTSVVTLLAANASRLGATFHNDSTVANLSLALGSAASLTDFTVVLVPDAYYELPFSYTGLVTGIWDTVGGGDCRVTELTKA